MGVPSSSWLQQQGESPGNHTQVKDAATTCCIRTELPQVLPGALPKGFMCSPWFCRLEWVR